MKKILIIRFSSIGDIVLTSPVIRCLKNQHPATELHFLVKKSFAGVVHNNPYLTKVWELNDDFKDLIKELKKEGFDQIIDLHKNLRSEKVKRNLKIPSFTFDKLNIEKWLLTNFKVDKLPKKHIVHRYFKAIQHLDVFYDGNGLDFFIQEKNHYDLSNFPIEIQNGYYVLVIGAAHATKAPTLELCINIIKKIKQPFILVGGKEDVDKAKKIEKEFKETKLINLVGKTNLEQSASIILQSKLVVTPDTGMMHIAAALNKPIVAIWGNTVPKFGMGPFYPENHNLSKNIEVKGLSCRPCSKIGFDKCPKKHFKCIQDISVDDIKDAAKNLRLNIE